MTFKLKRRKSFSTFEQTFFSVCTLFPVLTTYLFIVTHCSLINTSFCLYFQEPEVQFDVESHFEGHPLPQVGSLVINQVLFHASKSCTITEDILKQISCCCLTYKEFLYFSLLHASPDISNHVVLFHCFLVFPLLLLFSVLLT